LRDLNLSGQSGLEILVHPDYPDLRSMDQPLIDLQESSVDPALTPSPHADSRSILTNDNHQPSTSTPTGGSLTPTGNHPELRTIHVGVTDAGGVQPDKTEGLRWPWSKRDRLKRDTSMDKLDEEIEATKLLETYASKVDALKTNILY